MSLPRETYFIVLPNDRLGQELNEFCQQYNDSEFEFIANTLLTPYLMKTSLLAGQTNTYNISRAKLLFIAEKYDEYLDMVDEAPFRHLLKTLLGQPPFTLATFDNWWQLKSVIVSGSIDTFKTLEESMEYEVLDAISAPADDTLKTWLETLKAQAATTHSA